MATPDLYTTSIRIDQEHKRLLDAVIESYELVPTVQQVFEKAIEALAEQRGVNGKRKAKANA